MSDRRDDDDDDDVLAAELAFGLLDAPDRTAAERRCGEDAAFAASCDRWRAHAAAWLDGVDQAPDESVWTAIKRRLPANDEGGETVALRRAVRRWRAASGVLGLAALVLGAAALLRPPAPRPPAPIIVAAEPTIVLLTGAPDAGVVAISFDRTAGRLHAASTGLAIGMHAAELWVIPADRHPRSLGVIRANRVDARSEPAPLRALIAAGATLAITVEPAGGSPTGQPTGPVILSGKVVSG